MSGRRQPDGSESIRGHRTEADSLPPARCQLVVVSDTRTARTDVSGRVAADLVAAAGHFPMPVELVRDEPREIEAALDEFLSTDCDCLIFLGGTGLGARDQTVETIAGRLDKVIPGYGEAFRRISWDQIGTAAILSRALAGSIGDRIVAITPGSPNAVATALGDILLPELAHLLREVRR